MGLWDYLAKAYGSDLEEDEQELMTPGIARSMMADKLMALGKNLSGARLGEFGERLGRGGQEGAAAGKQTLAGIVAKQNDMERKAREKEMMEHQRKMWGREDEIYGQGQADRARGLSEDQAFIDMMTKGETLPGSGGMGMGPVGDIQMPGAQPPGLGAEYYKKAHENDLRIAEKMNDREYQELQEEKRLKIQEGRWSVEDEMANKRLEIARQQLGATRGATKASEDATRLNRLVNQFQTAKDPNVKAEIGLDLLLTNMGWHGKGDRHEVLGKKLGVGHEDPDSGRWLGVTEEKLKIAFAEQYGFAPDPVAPDAIVDTGDTEQGGRVGKLRDMVSSAVGEIGDDEVHKIVDAHLEAGNMKAARQDLMDSMIANGVSPEVAKQRVGPILERMEFQRTVMGSALKKVGDVARLPGQMLDATSAGIAEFLSPEGGGSFNPNAQLTPPPGVRPQDMGVTSDSSIPGAAGLIPQPQPQMLGGIPGMPQEVQPGSDADPRIQILTPEQLQVWEQNKAFWGPDQRNEFLNAMRVRNMPLNQLSTQPGIG